MNSSSSANSTISSYLSSSCSRLRPAARPPRHDVLAPGELAVEADAEREQRADAAVDLDAPARRRQDARDRAHERRLAGAVGADDAEHGAVRDLEGDVADRLDLLGHLRRRPMRDSVPPSVGARARSGRAVGRPTTSSTRIAAGALRGGQRTHAPGRRRTGRRRSERDERPGRRRRASESRRRRAPWLITSLHAVEQRRHRVDVEQPLVAAAGSGRRTTGSARRTARSAACRAGSWRGRGSRPAARATSIDSPSGSTSISGRSGAPTAARRRPAGREATWTIDVDRRASAGSA